MADSRRLREARQDRDFYVRAGNNDLRTNVPTALFPVPWDASADEYGPGDWHVGSDNNRYQGPGGLLYGPIGPGSPGWTPRSRTSGSPLTSYDQSGQPAGPSSIMPAVTRCTTLLVEAVCRTRWNYRAARGEAIPRPLWVSDPMLVGRAPGPIFPLAPLGRRLTGHTFWTTLMTDALWWGQGGFVFIEGSDGQPLAGSLELLNPFAFAVDEAGHVVLDRWGEYPLTTDHDGRFELNGQTWRVAVLHGQAPNHSDWPQGVLVKHFPTFRIGAKLGRYIDNFFDSGLPRGLLSVSTPNFGVEVPDPDNPGEMIGEEKLLKRKWMEAHGRGRRSIAVLNSMVAFVPLSLNPLDSDAARISELNLRDVAHAFGMSSIWLDIGVQGMSYSNSSERRADFVSGVAAGWGLRMTDLITALLPYGSSVEVAWANYISPSAETLMPALVQAVQAGILTGREARQYLNIEQWSGPDPDYQDTSKAATGIEPAPTAPTAPATEGGTNGDNPPAAE